VTGTAAHSILAESDPGEPMTTAERALRMAHTRAAGAEVEVTVRHGTEALTRFARSFIHQNVAQETNSISVRLALDGRSAAARLDGRPDDEALARLIDGALEAARVRPLDPDWPGIAPPAEAPDVDHWDEPTALASPDDRARLVGDFVAAGDGLETAGACATAGLSIAFANSAGQRLTGRMTSASLDGICRAPGSDGSGREAGVSLGSIDGRAIGERAAMKARSAMDPTELGPGRYEVLLEPQCVANMLHFLFVYGFNGLVAEEGRSFVRLGETQFDPAITLRDDVTERQTVGVAFDAEGTPKVPLDVIHAGVTSAILHTRRTAAKAGTQSTGHATADAWEPGAVPANIVIEPGDRSPERLIEGVGRGLLVTDFWYTRILDPRTQVVTGLTRNGVWLIEDGRIVRPVSNLRFTQSFSAALAPGAVRGVGSERPLIYGGGDGAALVPALHLAAWNFTGGARG